MEIKEVFEPVLNFIKNLQKKDKETASKQAAKDRLKLVLMQDRASVSPDFFEIMKQEIIDVIKKYIEIDEEALEVELTRGIEAGLEGPALYANIPIKNVKPVAPKAQEDDETDELITDNNGPLTEEAADKVADQILTQIEESVKADILNDQIVGEDGIILEVSSLMKDDDNTTTNVSGVIDDVKVEEKEEKPAKKKVTRATTAKKKTTSKATTKTKTTKTTKTAKTTTATKKKKEE